MDLSWLEEATRREMAGCRIVAHDGTTLFTPDGMGHYAALWTRDFAYMVENAWPLLDPAEVRAAIEYLLRGQRADGCIPDRVQADGLPVYSAGPVDRPLGEPPTDNGQFMISLVYHYARNTRDFGLAAHWLGSLRRGLDYIPRSPAGLVCIEPGRTRSPYGFTDTIAKTGELLFSSLLYWDACHKMSVLSACCTGDPYPYPQRAEQVERALDRLWDEHAGAYRAATDDCNQIDIWGTAYAVAIGVAQGKRKGRVLRFLRDRYTDYIYRGQVRHLLRGEYWEKTLMPVERETYQNGAYWATASGWVIAALAQIDPALARRTAEDLIGNFQQNGIYECINEGYNKLEHYVVSATNPWGALRQMHGLGTAW